MMRFGTFVPQGWKMDLAGVSVGDQWDRILQTARASEAGGYDSVWVYDHFHTHPIVSQESTFEAWTLMAALAAVTERVRLGQMCTCVAYRSPALLAKMASTVDAIAGGRLDVGIGAGWSAGEFGGYGYRFPPPRERLEMLEEAASVLVAMWTSDHAAFDGAHYSVDDAIARPRSPQRPHPPLWIAGGGERTTLGIVARLADWANFSGDVGVFRRKSEVLAGHCEEVGRPFDEIGRSAHVMAVVGHDRADLDRKLEVAASRRGCTPDAFADEHLAGVVDQVVAVMDDYRDAGCAEMILYFYDMGAADSLELFAAEVIPRLRG